MIRNLAFAVFLAAPAAAVTLPKTEAQRSARHQAVYGGSEVPQAMLRSTVGVQFESRSAPHGCTGVLLSPNVAAVAAHCFMPLTTHGREHADPLFVLLYDPAGKPTVRRVLGGFPHESFSRAPDHDIGLVVFEGALPSTHGPARRPAADLPLEGSVLTAIGIGYQDSSQKLSSFPLGIAMKVTSSPRDARAFQASGEGKTGVCMGDSGGPAFTIDPQGPILVGLTSTSSGSSKTCGPGTADFVRVWAYRAWIDSVLPTLQARAQRGS